MGQKKLILFTDSGDTILDESTQVFDEAGIVTHAEFIPGADDVLQRLHDAGYTIALVADGEWDSFQNVYRENGKRGCFDAWVVSERVGVQKPAPVMFQTAMEQLGLTEADCARIVMIGNNLKKDIAGANRMGFTSIWLSWSPRYFWKVEEPDWQPDYTVATPEELFELIERLNDELEERSPERVQDKLLRLTEAFCPILYEEDTTFLENMKGRNLAGDDIRRYEHWEWTQGVGLYGIWKLFQDTKEQRYLTILTAFFDQQLKIGFPARNVNTVTPFLTMSLVGEYLKEERYLTPCRETAEWMMSSFPRTEEGGFQHMTSDTLNPQELWDDTLFMSVLFLANMGRIEGRKDYQREAQYQFLLHAKYLADKKTGLWYHGWTFLGRHNFAEAFWGRGNCWITIALPEFLSMTEVSEPVRRALTELLLSQVKSLQQCQEKDGMWHTLLDDPDSYVEASATCGFGYGILRAVHMGLIDAKYEKTARKALHPILDYISEDGVLHQVSYGTPMGRESKEFYKQIELKPMPYGQALAMLFLEESLK